MTRTKLLTIAAVSALAAMSLDGATSQVPALAQAKADARAALPTAAQLRGYRDLRVFDERTDVALRATRLSDGLTMYVHIFAAADEDAVRRAARTATMTQVGRMPAGSLTGRRIGQEVWHDFYPEGGPPRGAYKLVTRIGRALVVVDLMHRITPMPHGAPIEPVFSTADLRWAEDVAIGCVNRLVRMGYGKPVASRPATRSATNARRR